MKRVPLFPCLQIMVNSYMVCNYNVRKIIVLLEIENRFSHTSLLCTNNHVFEVVRVCFVRRNALIYEEFTD